MVDAKINVGGITMIDWQWVVNHWGQIAGFWLLFEQVLANTSLGSNSTFQLVCNAIDGAIRILTPKQNETATDTARPN